MNDDLATELIEVLKEVRDQMECHTKVLSKGIHMLRNELRDRLNHDDDGGDDNGPSLRLV